MNNTLDLIVKGVIFVCNSQCACMFVGIKIDYYFKSQKYVNQ